MTLRYLSVCSGIEAATQAWHPLGWTPVAFSEIEAFPSAVLAHHYPAVPNRGDMTKFQDWPDDTVDLLCGGTPCQSFSVAGLRQGLADPRGNLMLTFGAIAGRYRPRWLVWENVPGVLSSNGGRDFAAFLGLLGELGYGWAYRVLDAQHVRTRRFPFAVPQRRRRVFVVGYLGDWRRAAAVLFDRESLSGNPAPRRQAGQGTSATVAPSLTSSGRGVERAGETRGQDPVVAVSNSGPVGYCLTASAQQSPDAETETLIAVAHALRGEGFDASEDGTGRGTPLVPVGVFQDSEFGVQRYDSAGTLRAGRIPEHQMVLQPIAIQVRAVSENVNAGPGGSGISTEGAAYTLEARNNVQAVAFNVTPSNSNKDFNARPASYAQAVTTDGGRPSARGGDLVAAPWAVRRLTPRECERLQGFPDDFTLIPYRGKPASDGPRYKALGNSWAVNCAEWIGERIAEVDGWDDERLEHSARELRGGKA
jgi:DNA (cytosine-5)-methyltransferase 1